MEDIPADCNHPYSTPLKRRDDPPDNFFVDKPVPKFWFGDRVWLRHFSHRATGEVVGIVWCVKHWKYSINTPQRTYRTDEDSLERAATRN